MLALRTFIGLINNEASGYSLVCKKPQSAMEPADRLEPSLSNLSNITGATSSSVRDAGSPGAAAPRAPRNAPSSAVTSVSMANLQAQQEQNRLAEQQQQQQQGQQQPAAATTTTVKTSRSRTSRNLRRHLGKMADTLTEEQIAEYKDAFRMHDKDGRGSLSIKEIGTVLRSMGQNPTEAEIADMVAQIDKEGSGMIDFTEFLVLSVTTITRKPETEKDIIKCFRTFDKEGNGFLATEDLRQIMTSIGEKLNEDELEVMIQEADVDGDGHVSYEEFVRNMMSKP